MGYPTLTIQYDNEIALFALTVPEKRNAVSSQMITDLLSALEQAQDSSARVLIITGAGKAFCAGMDLGEMQAMGKQTTPRNFEDSRRLAKLFYRLYGFPKPVIAAVNGPAIAGGCGIATLCDFTLAVPEAKFGYPEVHIGFLPAIVSVFLIRQVGEKHARDMLLTGRIVDAGEADRMGLITEIVPAQELQNAAKMLANSLLASSPASLLRTKKLLCDFTALEVDRELDLAVAAGAEIRSTADFREGLASFLEKRAARWNS